ncbi:hypothetical protein [Baaleninema sp.]|uniref:hypothetical protein n=1 Tax=Baaleninema sp. TaxID=3101197 RepID=UPI003D017B49
MSRKTDLIKQIAREIGWTQTDIQRAIRYCECKGNSKEEIIACCIKYSGSELKRRNRIIGNLKGKNKKQQDTIELLVDRVSQLKDFYSHGFDVLKATIREQANYIDELLRDIKDKDYTGGSS